MKKEKLKIEDFINNELNKKHAITVQGGGGSGTISVGLDPFIESDPLTGSNVPSGDIDPTTNPNLPINQV
ncbi:hypothetical protein [Flavobacterium sp.]|uniref:hypothetical protein n=1 Tax=Flavobacterium sp. TaxID=239 RepID=UPI002B4AF05E|nr:hypothetical protein [Flavobacterium sp.]HLF50706.1 hypothetical protein [Flavobacterium sp.]